MIVLIFQNYNIKAKIKRIISNKVVVIKKCIGFCIKSYTIYANFTKYIYIN